MSVVVGTLAPGRSVDGDSFSDIVPGWVTVELADGQVVASFAKPLTAQQEAACHRRITMPPEIESAFIALEQRVAALESQSSVSVSVKGLR